MICSGKEWDTCREEKQGCEGCYYSKISEEEKELVRAFRRMKEMGVKKMVLSDAEGIDSQLEELKKTSEAHRELVGRLYKQLDERTSLC